MTVPGRRAALSISLLYALTAPALPEAAHAATGDGASGPAARVTEPSATAAAPSARVREAQALMRELGLWDGPADGVTDAAFRDAAQDARRRFALPAAHPDPVDGRLLSALRGRVEASRTQRKLDTVRAEEVARAEAAVAASPTLAGALRPRPGDARAAAGRDLAACRAAPTVVCLLDEARETAKTVSEPDLRDWGLTEIAEAKVAESGSLDAAWPVLRLMADPRGVFFALRNIAAAEAAAGRPKVAEAAARAADTLPEAAARAHADAAAALAARPDADAATVERLAQAAEARLAQVSDAAARRATLVSLARAAAARGAADLAAERLDRAEQTGDSGTEDLGAVAAARGEIGGPSAVAPMIARATAPAARRAVLVALAQAQARAGDGTGARRTITEIPEARYRAVALADAGAVLRDADLVARAAAAAAEITLPFARAFALSRVAEAWLVLDQPQRALAEAESLTDDRLKVEALRRIALAPGAPPDLAARAGRMAAETQAAMIDRATRLRLLAAETRLLAGRDPAAAGRAARRAVDDAVATRDPWNRLRALTAAADAVAAAREAGVALPPPDSAAQ